MLALVSIDMNYNSVGIVAHLLNMYVASSGRLLRQHSGRRP